MKEVAQGETITLDVRFYDVDPGLGGIPTDPDSYLHTWSILNDVMHRVSAISLFLSAVWPPNPTYYFSIVDSGVDFRVNAYTDVARTAMIATTGALAYGVYTNQALVAVGASGYSGTITLTFPHIGVGFETFDITDIGATEPVYQIRDEDNTLAMIDTLYPTRTAQGHYQTTYPVDSLATPGENWRIISRGKINNIDVYYTEYFRVVDATAATEEAAKFVTLSELKNALEITDSTKDAYLDALILPACQACEDYLDAKFHVEDNSFIFDGNNMDRVYLDGDGPIYSITALSYRNGTTWTPLTVSDYMSDGNFITLFNGNLFNRGSSNWKLDYQFGVDRAPALIRQGVCELIRYWNATKNRGGALEDTIGGGIKTRYEELKADLPAQVLQIWKGYRKLA